MNQGFIGRKAELERLNSFLQKALRGETQVCFVLGEAGTGKSTLLAEFARQQQDSNENLIFSIGSCNAQTGISDPYLPFREILGMLTGDEARLVGSNITDKNAERLKGIFKASGRALIEIAPELIGTLIPGAGILIALARMGAKERGLLKGLEERATESEQKKGEIDQSQIFLQFTALLRKLSTEHPLVIVLDDLQWIDTASNALFFHLTRELQGCRILLVGLYRPNDVAAGRNQERHPFEQTRNEIVRYFGDVWIDLDKATKSDGREFVDALIDSEPNNLSVAFRDALFTHTGGHALFTVELLRGMQETGDLVQDPKGQWQEASTLDWDEFPAKVEAIIKERIGRLTEELREILEIACVEGRNFTAQVIAQIQQAKERDLVRKLSRELGSRHQLVQENGELKLGKAVLSRYSFSHALFQAYLYNALDAAELRLLHADVADSLEQLYEEYPEEIAVQLAFHYTRSGETNKASKYLQMAGEKAFRVSEFNQAREYFNQALDLTGTDDTEQSDKARAYLLGRIGDTYDYTSRWDAAEIYYRKSIEVARQSGDDNAISQGLHGLANSLRRQRVSEEALEAAQEALEIAQRTSNRSQECQALRMLGIIYGQMDRTDERLSCYERAHEIATEIEDVPQEMASLNNLGVVFGGVFGNYEKAVTYYEQAMNLATQHHRIVGQIYYSSNLFEYRRLGNSEKAKRFVELNTELRNKIGDTAGSNHEDFGIMLIHSGNIHAAIAKFESSIQIADDHKSVTIPVSSRNWLVVSYLILNQLEDALRVTKGTRALLSKYEVPNEVYSEILLEGITHLRIGQFDEAKSLFERAMLRAVQGLRSKRWAYRYHQAFAQSGLTLLVPVEERASSLEQMRAYFHDAIDTCGWVGVLDDVLLVLREVRKADPLGVLQPIEKELVEKREIAWNNRPFKD